jgi:hypothetical protein
MGCGVHMGLVHYMCVVVVTEKCKHVDIDLALDW